MRAALLRNTGDEKLDVVDIELEDTAPGQVRVRIRATGVCPGLDMLEWEGPICWGF